jgi:triacylglycerol lipase
MTPYQTYAVMVLCARDVDVIWHNLATPQGNPTLPAAGTAEYAYVTDATWTALAQLRCNDQIISKSDNVYYGLLLRCHTASPPFAVGDYLVAVRGTMNQQEWENDALAIFPTPAPGGVGMVGTGFWDVYASMTLNDLAGGNGRSPVAPAIAAMVAAAPGKVSVCGHSLGSALATYLTADLQTALGPGVELDPYFFASPKPGTTDYVNNYQQTVTTYTLVNYAVDLVPMVPPELMGYAALNPGGPSHDVHIITYPTPGGLPLGAANNHSPVGYARMLDPGNAIAKALPAP